MQLILRNEGIGVRCGCGKLDARIWCGDVNTRRKRKYKASRLGVSKEDWKQWHKKRERGSTSRER